MLDFFSLNLEVMSFKSLQLLLLPLLLVFCLDQVYSDDDPTTYIPRAIYLQSNASFTRQDDLNFGFNYVDNSKDEIGGLKIINGNVAAIGQFPYMVALGVFLKSTTFFCGGVLLTPTTVLTAAHCIQGAEDIKVFLGVFDLMDFDEAGSYITFVEPPYIKGHPQYSPSNYYNDIAILRLDSPVPLSSTIQTVKLPKQPLIVQNSSVLAISGWGKIKDSDRTMTDKLHYYYISGQDYASCQTFYQTKSNYTLSSNHICTSGAGGVGPCRGDSGGPLVQIFSNGTYLLYGLNSLGIISCGIGAPTVYTEVYKYRDWIKANSDYTD